MAWTKLDLFSHARGCSHFTLAIESAPWEHGQGKSKIVIARYDGWRGGEQTMKFPARKLRYAFEAAQNRANEIGQRVRLIIDGTYTGEDVDSPWSSHWGVKDFEPQPDCMVNTQLACSCCDQPANRRISGNSHGYNRAEYTCDNHHQLVVDHYTK